MNHIDTMKLALEALETERPYLGPMPSKTSKAITALREALAEQPAQQEPEYIQLRHKEEDGFSPWGQPLDPKYRHNKWAADVEMRLLYTTPQAQPAQQQEQEQFTEDAPADCKRLAEHGAPICGRCHMGPCKYTTPQAQPAQQEPVACAQIVSLNDTQGVVEWLPHNGAHLKAGDYLYTSPPAQRKPWVGLEPGEISKIATSDTLAWANLNTVENRQYFARAIEFKLKEKNT